MPQFPGVLGGDSGSEFQSIVGNGAENDDAEAILRSHLNPVLKGKAWESLIYAIATGEQLNWDNARTAFDQLFKISANGIYLEQRAADDGLQKPVDIGMPDNLFRQYAIRTTNNKLVESALLDIIEVFYGPESVRAYSDSETAAPFAFAGGETLSILLDERNLVKVTFSVDDFDFLPSVTAAEVAAAITRAFRLNEVTAYALSNVNVLDGSSRVRIYSGATGLGSSVRIVGGSAQNILQFDTILQPLTLPVSWDVTPNTTTGITRFQVSGGVADLSVLVPGDYVNIFGTVFNVANRGAFTILNVYYAYPGGVLTQYFEVNLNGATQAGVVQVRPADLSFFRPTRKTSFNSYRTTTVAAVGNGVNIIIPATSQAVGRTAKTAAYGKVATSIAISALERINGVVTVATATNHGLLAGDQVFIDEAYASYLAPAVTDRTDVRANGGTSDYSKKSNWSSLTASASTGAVHPAAVLLPDGRALVAGGDLGGASGPYTPVAVCQLFRINSISHLAGTEIQVDYDSLAATALPVATTLANMTRGPAGTTIATNAIFTGGVAGAGAFKTVKKFDPVAGGGLGAWSALADMAHVRCAHTQTVLGSNVLVSGGATAAAGTVIGTAELYDPAANTWVDTASAMNVARCEHQAVLMANGKVLVTGGRNLASGALFYTDSFASITNTGPILSSCEFYQPSDDSWRLTGPMAYARFQHALILLPDGRVLAVGGLGYNPSLAAPSPMTAVRDCEIYNPVTGRWSPAGRLGYGRATVIAALLTDRGQVIVTGGSESRATEIFDIATGLWSTSPSESVAYRPRAVGVAMANDLVFMAGGVNGNTTFVDTNIGLYIPNQDNFMGGGLNGLVAVDTVPGSTSFTYKTEKTGYSLNASGTATATPLKAPASGTIPGPYLWDTSGGVAVTDKKSAIQSTLSAGHRYGSVDVADATVFPDSTGWLVFDFGFENQVGPVKYLGRLSNTTLSIDYGFKFTKTVLAGALVTLLASKGTFVPEHPEQVGSFYLTASPAGRVAASAAIDGAVGVGIAVHKTVEYPGDRGLGNEGSPDSGSVKVSDVVEVWSGDDIDAEVDAARAS